jgi:hypothetical protein
MTTPSLDEFVGACWNDHATDPAGVFARFASGVSLVREARHVPPFAGIVVHVAGEHLGRWQEGLDILRVIAGPPLLADSPEGRALARSRAVLELCLGDRAAAQKSALAARSGASQPFASDLARILAIASAALAGQGRTAEAAAMFEEAMSLASYGPTATDPAARALAVTANNLASAFEERPNRTAAESALMVRAAEAARDWWGLAGTWLEADRAEYRLSSSCRHAGDGARALEHARRCLRIIEANGSDPYEETFAHEQLALAHRAMGDALTPRRERDAMASCAARVKDADSHAFCVDQLAALDRALAG